MDELRSKFAARRLELASKDIDGRRYVSALRRLKTLQTDYWAKATFVRENAERIGEMVGVCEAAIEEARWIDLFDGRSVEGWEAFCSEGATDDWSAADGAIRHDGSGRGWVRFVPDVRLPRAYEVKVELAGDFSMFGFSFGHQRDLFIYDVRDPSQWHTLHLVVHEYDFAFEIDGKPAPKDNTDDYRLHYRKAISSVKSIQPSAFHLKGCAIDSVRIRSVRYKPLQPSRGRLRPRR